MLLLPYQQRWVTDPAPVQISEKSRRIGMTWASALRAVLEGCHEGGWDTYYSGYNTDLAKEFIRDAGDFARLVNAVVVENKTVDAVEEDGELVFNEIGKNGEPKGILGFLIRFASGHQIVALSSHPRNLRGKKGRIVLDEFAFHDNGEELLKAALAIIMWGGRLSVISTHDGIDNYFNTIIEDVRAGRFDYSLHRTTLDDAMEEGLYERIADILNLPKTTEAKAKWRKDLVAFYGDGADEELFCIPRRGGGVYINPDLVRAAMSEDCKVLRLYLDDAYALKPEEEREQHIATWCETVLGPELKKLDQGLPTYLGQDFGRKSDLSVIAVGQELQDLKLHCTPLIELRNVPYKQQEQLLKWLFTHVPRAGKLAMDATGNGAYLAEVMVQGWGETLCEGIPLNLPWYAENLPKFRARFEDGDWVIPKDLDVRQDLAAIQVIDGVPKLPKAKQQSKTEGKGVYRHGDAAIALAMLDYAARQGAAVFKKNERPTSKPRGGYFPKGQKVTW